jgi:hypothetical protein
MPWNTWGPAAGAVACSLVLAAVPTSSAAAPTELYAAPSGGGTLCTLAAPCTLLGARDKARTLIPQMSDDIRINLRGGTYLLAAPFELTGISDSGRAPWYVRYEAYPGETPVLSGGTTITGWTQVSKTRWRAPVPAGFQTRQLYVNGVRGQRTRTELGAPGMGFTETSNGYTVTNTAILSWVNPSDIEIVDLNKWKAYRCSVAEVGPDAVGAKIAMDEPCWSRAQWHQAPGEDRSMNPPDADALYGLGWIENVYELLGRPGDWYHYRGENFIIYVPRPGQDMATAEVVAPTLETLLEVEGTLDFPVRNVAFTGLTFSHATWLRPSTPAGYPVMTLGQMVAATVPIPGLPPLDPMPGNVAVRAAIGVSFEGNTFTRLGAMGLSIEMGCQSITVRGNRFEDISGGALSIGDVNRPRPTDPRELTKDITVDNNYVTDIGVEYWDTAGIFASFTDSAWLTHNEIHNVPYTGISLGWPVMDFTIPTAAKSNLIASNLIHRVMQKVFDGGLIYVEGEQQPGSVVKGNYLHNQLDVFGALYLDFRARYFSVTGNVVASTPYWYLVQGGGDLIRSRDNVIEFNYTESPDYLCGGEHGSEGETRCFAENTVSNNTVVPPQTFHPSALPVMQAAGLQPAYLSIKPATVRVEAEDYDALAAFDATPGNQGNSAYRAPDGVDLFADWKRSNHVMVGNVETGDYLPYHIDAPVTGGYTFGFSVSPGGFGNTIKVVVDSIVVGTVYLPPGSPGVFQNEELPATVTLSQGPHILGLQMDTLGGFDFDYFYYRR